MNDGVHNLTVHTSHLVFTPSKARLLWKWGPAAEYSVGLGGVDDVTSNLSHVSDKLQAMNKLYAISYSYKLYL